MRTKLLLQWGFTLACATQFFGCSGSSTSFTKPVVSPIETTPPVTTPPPGPGASLRFMDPSDTTVVTSWTWNNQAVNSFYDVPIIVANSGGSTATLLNVSVNSGPFSFKGGNWPGTDGDCPALGSGTLNAGGFCHVILRYNPTTIGQNDANLSLTYFDGSAQQQIPLSMFGTSADAPFLTISDSPTADDPLGHNFGTLLTGSSSSLTLYVTNLGSKPAETIVGTPLAAPFAFAGGNYPGTGGTCGAALASQAQCTLKVTYAPTSPGFLNDVLKLTYSNGAWAAPAYLALSGTGAIQQTPPVLVITPVAANPAGCPANTACFGNVPAGGAAASLTFNVTNSGTEAATGINANAFQTSAFSFKGGAYPGTGGTCTAGPFNGSCTIVVSFQDANAGTVNDQISVAYDQDGGTPAQLAVTGTGVAGSSLAVTPNPGTCSAPAGYHCSISLTVTNAASTTTATSISTTLSGTNASNFSKTSDTCTGASLAAGATCNVTLQFSPAAGTAGVGSAAAVLGVNYFTGASTATASANLTGTGTAAPFLVVSPTSQSFGTQTVGTTSSSKSFTITYYGADPASVSYAYTGGSAGFSVPASGTVSANSSFGVTFTPPATGSLSDTLKLSYSDATTSAAQTAISIAMSGTGGAPLSGPGSLAFGNVVVGTTYSQTLTYSDPSGATISSPAITQTGSSTFTYTAPSCTSSSCTTSVTFTPTADAADTGSLKFTYSSKGQTMPAITTSLTGTGIAPLAISPTSLSFGTLLTGSTSSASTVTISFQSGNGGKATSATIGAIAAGNSAYTIAGSGTSPCTLTGGAITASCTFTVQFSPSAAASYSSSISITDTTSGGVAMTNPLKVNLSGTGGGVATLGSAQSYTFPSTVVGSSKSTTFTFTNAGGVPATSLAVTAVSAPFSITSNNCSGTLNAGSSCSVQVQFAPTGAPGPFSGSFTLSYNNGSSSQSVTASFSGSSTTQGSLTVTGSSASFGSITLGAPAVSRTFTVTNGGTAAATALNAGTTPTGTPFSYPGGFPGTGGTCQASGTVAVSSSCTIVVQFNPTAPGNFSDSIVLSYNNGAGTQTTSALAISGTATITPAIAVNGNHSCVIQANGSTVCFGRNNVGQLGIGNTTDQGNPTSNTDGAIDTSSMSSLTPVNFGSGHWATQVVAGYWHTCAILNDSSVRCWGHNDQGQLGYGDTTDRLAPSSTAVNLGTGKTAKSLALGYSHSCAILNDNSLKCWGNNSYGQLGLGDENNRGDNAGEMGDSLPAIDLGGAVPTQVTANAGHTCALLTGGAVKCWGDNFYGQLGQGDFASRGGSANQMGTNLPAINLGTGKTAVEIAAGGGYTCAILNDGSLKCWGQNESSNSVSTSNPNGYTGSTGTCWALDNNSNAGPCWNSAFPDQTRGYGIAANQMGDDLPSVSLPNGLSVVSVTTGNLHTCAVLSDGSTRCWGDNVLFELGATPGNATPAANRGIAQSDMGNNLPSLSGAWSEAVTQVVSGGAHTCALLADASVKCWGTIQSSQ